MTESVKWTIFASLLALAFYGGWFLPWLWLVAILTGLVLLVIPTKPQAKGIQQAQPQPTDSDLQSIELELRQRLQVEPNEDVREGLRQALGLIHAKLANTPVDEAQVQVAEQTSQTLTDMPTIPLQHIPRLPEPTIEEKAALKKTQELRNINTILYTASFLLIGAAAIFIGLADGLSATIKFMTVLLVAALFYIVGMVLHVNSERLRPAAVAFVGTGLALIPFVGLAFYSYVLSDGPLVWWLTSMIGFVAFWLALLRIKASVMSYLTIAFVFSIATSSVAVLRIEFLWYFVAIIVTSSLLMLLSYKRPRWLPLELSLPLEQSAQLATPIALIGSLFMFSSLSTYDYAIIHGIGALHYLVNALGFSRDDSRYIYWFMGRFLTISFAATLAYAVSENWDIVAAVLTISALLTHFYSINYLASEPREKIWLWLTHGLLLVSMVIWNDYMDIFSLVLAIVAVLSLHQLYISRRVEYSIVGILATMLLPITVIQGVIDHQIGYELTAAVVLIMSAVTLAVRAILVHRPVAYQQAATALFGVLTAYASLLAISSGEAIWFGSIATISAVLLYVASFVVRQPLVHIASHAFGALGVLALFGESLNDYTWAPLAMGVSLGAILYGLRWYFAAEKEQTADAKQRVDIMAISAITLIVLTSFISLVASETIVAGALIGCVGAGMIAYEGFVRSLRPPYEIALYIATICLQRLVAEVYPDASFLVYTHWWAVTGGLAALLYYKRTDNISHALVRSILALVILSVPSGLFALADPNKYQLLFLLEHVALIVAGVATGKSLLIRWGAVGVVLALLWLLRGYTYVLLALLALSLISLAIWRLLRKT